MSSTGAEPGLSGHDEARTAVPTAQKKEKPDEAAIVPAPTATSEADQEKPDSMRFDRHGLPLVPQPSTNSSDPLNWSPGLKLLVTFQVSILALLQNFSAAVANPAFVPMGKAFHMTTLQASYQLTVFIICNGIGPLIILPLGNVYGRRPVYLIGGVISALMNVIAGFSPTWAGILATRAFCGLAAGTVVAMGPATVCDMYFLHERGLYMGIWVFFLTNGPHFASLAGGFIAQYLGWRWCFLIPGFIQLGVFAFNLFCLPETLYARNASDSTSNTERSFMDLLLFRNTRLNDRKVELRDFLHPLLMLRYLAVLLPAIWYMTAFSYGTVLFAITGSSLFAEFYRFNVAQTGLLLSVPLLIGCLIGEANAGWLVDWLVYRDAKRHDGHRRPEARLNALWFALLLPVGTIIEGVCISHFKTVGWIGSAFGMGISSVGLQAATTTIYSYCTDCYKPQATEVSAVLNAFRSIFSALVGFYAIPLGVRIQYEYAWLVFALINVVLLGPLALLRFRGEQWRQAKWQRPPRWHEDI